MNINGIYALYENTYGNQSVCNHHEVQAIFDAFSMIGKVDNIELVMSEMRKRVGQPSVKHAMPHYKLPTVGAING